MIQNIKVDVIYYLTATDFEFEFNLGGCCHMRLLNDKANDKKSFVNSLARAVSRSQIIISCGPLFGEDGLIATAAAAINRGLQPLDNKTFGISDDSEIKIIEGAVPLVTPEGYFGGCIIESGNQSIITLTENRTIRRTIMKTLVHPYIEDMSIMQSAETGGTGAMAEPIKSAAQPEKPILPQVEVPAIPEPIVEEPAIEEPFVEEPVIEAPDSKEKPEPAAELQTDADFEPDDTSIEQDDEHNIEFDFSPDVTEEPTEEKSDEIEFKAAKDNYLMPNGEDDEQPAKKSKKGNGINITILIIAALLILIIFALCYFFIYLPIVNGTTATEYIKQVFTTASNVSKV